MLESIYVGKLTVINRYPVYNADIKPIGFEFIELDGFVDEKSVQKTRLLLDSPDEEAKIAKKKYQLAQEHFSFEVLESKFKDLLANF